MATGVKLPPGFVIEKKSNLPEGFVLEEPAMGMADGKPTTVKRISRFDTASKLGRMMLGHSLPESSRSEMNAIRSLAPMTGQILGGLTRLKVPGSKWGGSTAGAAAGETLGQGLDYLTGGDFKPEAIRNEALMTGGVEGVFRGVPRIAFVKQFGGKAREVAGKALGGVREKVMQKAPFLRMSKNDIVQRIDDALASSPFESGPQRQALIKIKNRLMKIKQPLTFDEAVQLEQQMGREASFATEATQGRLARGPKAPRANQALKSERATVSGNVDDMASQAGFPEHKAMSAKYAKLASKYPEKDLQRMYSPLGMAIRGATFSAAGALPTLYGGEFNPYIAAVGGWASLPPAYKTKIFRNVVDSPMGRKFGRALTVGSSEALRRSFGDQS